MSITSTFYDLWDSIKSYLFSTPIIEDNEEKDIIMLPITGDRSCLFNAVRIWDGGFKKKRVVIQLLMEGIKIYENNIELEQEFWSWNSIKQIEFHSEAQCIWWRNEEEGTNISFEEVNVPEFEVKLREILDKRKNYK